MNKINVLWITNMILPELAKHLNIKTSASGTWMFDLSRKISENSYINLAVAAVYGDEFKEIKINNTVYYILPGTGKSMLFYTKKYEKIWEIINEKFKPDLVHLHGTEYSHGLSFLRKIPSVKAFLSIQGVISKINQANFDGLPKFYSLKYRTLKECLKLNGFFENYLLMKKNVAYENEIIKRVSFATGRTFWDKNILETINPNIKYFRCNYNVREEFYNSPKWDIKKAKRFTIYGSTAIQIPLKGGHILLKALGLVKLKYPNVKAVFLLPNCVDGKFVINNGFGKYINSLIKKYDLQNNVEFIPSQGAKGIIDNMLNSHCVVIPSQMENASATLRESMHLGVPSIASYRGGMTELIKDGESGLFFDFLEHEYLAGRIIEVFENDELAKEISVNAIKQAEIWHNREKNPQDMIEIYNKICERIGE